MLLPTLGSIVTPSTPVVLSLRSRKREVLRDSDFLPATAETEIATNKWRNSSKGNIYKLFEINSLLKKPIRKISPLVLTIFAYLVLLI